MENQLPMPNITCVLSFFLSSASWVRYFMLHHRNSILLLLSSSSSPLSRVFIRIFLRQTMSVGNTVLHFCYYSWCLYC